MPHTLCQQCGLCCDGTFFGSVVVAEQEKPRLERVGLRVIQSGQNGQGDASGSAIAMPQPCVALRGCLCAAYEDRPGACAKYECELRKKVAAGGCTVDEALAKVATMRALLASIREAFDCPPTTSIWERILTLAEPEGEEARAIALRDHAAAIDAVGQLLELGRAEFEPRFAGGGGR